MLYNIVLQHILLFRQKNSLHSHASYLVDNIILTKNRTNLQNNVDCRQQLFQYKYTNKIDKNKGIAYFLKQAIPKKDLQNN